MAAKGKKDTAQTTGEKTETFRNQTGRYNLYQEEYYTAKPVEAPAKEGKPKGPKGEDEFPDGEKIDPEKLRYYMPRHGRTLHRALDQLYVTRSAFHDPGAFGRMFPTLPSVQFTNPSLENLAKAMLDPAGGADNPALTAGFTFLGQFIDHDITFDPTSSLEKQNDPEAIHNFRTPVLELDSMYGSGPATMPFLYDAEDVGKLLIGRDAENKPNDLPRNRQGVALLGDPRNDENLIVSQLHLTFLKFHNKALDHVRANGIEGGVKIPPEIEFEETQRVVRWHYQWMVVNTFLRKTLGEKMWSRLVEPDKPGKKDKEPSAKTVGQDPIGNILDGVLKFFRWKREPFIPVEFAVAAYRFGHSQIRPGYRINAGFASSIFPGLHVPASLDVNKVLVAGRAIEWSRFFDLGTGGGPLQQGKTIDTALSSPLGNLPGFVTIPSLPERNLKRSNAFSLPWGQRVALAIGERPLTDDQLAINGTKLTALGFPPSKAPLWYYILKEADVQAAGQHLGEVGGRIVGEVFLGLLKGDFKSYFNQDPCWQPFLPAKKKGDFTIADLINFATAP